MSSFSDIQRLKEQNIRYLNEALIKVLVIFSVTYLNIIYCILNHFRLTNKQCNRIHGRQKYQKVWQTSQLSTMAIENMANGSSLSTSTIYRSPMATQRTVPIAIGNRQWMPLSPFQQRNLLPDVVWPPPLLLQRKALQKLLGLTSSDNNEGSLFIWETNTRI